MTAKAPVTGKRPFRMIAGVSTLSDLADGQGAGWGYPGSGYAGVQYFVNNITGSATASGLSWDDPFDQVSTAVTASEAQRQLPTATTNEYVRNQIFVQGTGTSYTALTALPNYCDIIGIGATPYGDGAGIAVIGGAGADGIAGSARGLGLYNLQFQAGGVYICADFVNLFRSEIAFCTFQARTTDCAAGLRFSAASSGNYIHDCMWTAGGGAAWTNIGIDIDGPSFTMNRIQNNIIRGVSAAIDVVSTCVDSGATVVKDNVLTGILTVGIIDAATTGGIVYCGNYICASTGNEVTITNNTTSRLAGNWAAAIHAPVT